MTKLERKADEIITLYKEKYMEDLEKDFSIKDNDTKNLNLVIKNDTGSKILFTLSDFSEDMSTEEIVDCIHKEAQCEKRNLEFWGELTKKFKNFENVKERLFVRLLNTERNQERLSDVITKPWHNLSMVLCINLKIPGKDNYGNIYVKKQFMEIWNKTVDELFNIAFENADKNFPMKPIHVVEKILSMQYPFLSEDTLQEMKRDILKEQKFCLYVCLNENVGSAAGFLYPSVIGTLEPGDYILPSSTEQCLIVKHNDLELEALLETVSEVNQTEEIADDMFLSNNVYEYVGNSEFVMH